MLTYFIICTAAHPNIRLFITHGGQFSTIEAITRGVPVVGIPVFADQRKNILLAVFAGYGLLIDFNNITTESLTWAIQEVIETPKYVLLFLLLKWFTVVRNYIFSNNP
jgi:glucuronosyltransferase